jgi:hypothetical protein
MTVNDFPAAFARFSLPSQFSESVLDITGQKMSALFISVQRKCLSSLRFPRSFRQHQARCSYVLQHVLPRLQQTGTAADEKIVVVRRQR